jgi:hypothetical protein
VTTEILPLEPTIERVRELYRQYHRAAEQAINIFTCAGVTRPLPDSDNM